MGRLLTAALAAGSLLYGSSLYAQTNAEPLQWLQRIYSATDALSYTGTFVYQHGERVETSRIARIVDASGLHERVETLDGPQREIVRDNDEVKCYLPQLLKIKVDSQRETQSYPALRGDQLKDIAEQYDIRKGDVERIAGYDCQVLTLEPKDGLRYGHKLWADVNTGMLLKAKTFNARGELLEQIVFTQLKIGGRIDKNLVKSRFASVGRDWEVEDSDVVPADLTKLGWSIKILPPGYKKIAELRRNVGETQNVGHIVLSDGLAAVSIFIESLGAKAVQAQAGASRQGPLNIYTRKFDTHLITVVGEVPPLSVRTIANAVEYRPPN